MLFRAEAKDLDPGVLVNELVKEYAVDLVCPLVLFSETD
jgi:hypothetical protein